MKVDYIKKHIKIWRSYYQSDDPLLNTDDVDRVEKDVFIEFLRSNLIFFLRAPKKFKGSNFGCDSTCVNACSNLVETRNKPLEGSFLRFTSNWIVSVLTIILRKLTTGTPSFLRSKPNDIAHLQKVMRALQTAFFIRFKVQLVRRAEGDNGEGPSQPRPAAPPRT